MRLFITVNMSENVKEDLANELPIIKSNYQSGKWVPKENLHITMLFLGEVEKEKLGLVEASMEEAIKGINSFQLWLEGLGVFPNEKNPKILWAGVRGDSDELKKLYSQLLHAAQKKGIPFDAKPHYTPHVTLARKIGSGNIKEEIGLETSKWLVNELELYESIFTPEGVKYQKILTKKFIN